MYELNLLILLCILSAFLGICVTIFFTKRANRRRLDSSLPLARNVRVIISKEITDTDMMVAIINLSKMKLSLDKMAQIDKREEFKEKICKIVDEVYDDR